MKTCKFPGIPCDKCIDAMPLDEVTQALRSLVEERDEARRERDKARIDAMPLGDVNSMLRSLAQERDEARHERDEARRERDVYKAQVERARGRDHLHF